MNPIIKTKLIPPNIVSQKQQLPIRQATQPGFEQYLDAAINELKFSKHALLRLENRKLEPELSQIARLQEGIEMARSKGSINSLVLVDNLAFVVSVKNNTVVTAMCVDQKESKVFSQIDTTVIN